MFEFKTNGSIMALEGGGGGGGRGNRRRLAADSDTWPALSRTWKPPLAGGRSWGKRA